MTPKHCWAALWRTDILPDEITRPKRLMDAMRYSERERRQETADVRVARARQCSAVTARGRAAAGACARIDIHCYS